MRASYPTYKSTSIPWLPEMPEHWDALKAKHIFKERSEKGYPDEPLLAATQTKGVVRKEEYETRTVTAQKDFHLLKLVKEEDFVISLRSFQGGIEYAYHRGIISPAYTIFYERNKVAVNKAFYRHLFKSHPFINSLTLFVTGIREGQNIDYAEFKDSLLPFPPLPEQTAIANYLDAKTEQINRFIEKKEKLIALLKEQKQAVINELLEDKEGKWERRRLKYCVKSIVSGGTPSMDNKLFWQNGTIPWVSPKDMKLMFINNTEMYVTELAVNSTVLKIIPSGSILIVVRSGILQRTIPIAFNSVPVTVNQDLKAITLNDRIIDPLYFYYFIKGFERRILSLCRKVVATVDSLEMMDLLNYKLIVPPIEKQRELTIKTKDSLQRIDKTISQIEKEIEKVKELKQSLIAEVVTGKIKVV